MEQKEFSSLLLHEYWANMKLHDMLISLDTIPEKATLLFNHIIAAQDNWMSRIKGLAPNLEIWWDNKLPGEWKSLLIQHHEEWIKLAESDVDSVVTYRNSRGQEFSNSIREIILHLCMHGQYHRGQIITLTRGLVETPPSTDYIAFLRQANK